VKALTPEECWSLNHFAMLREGGVWAVPRSGLLFRKEGNALILIARMPYTSEMAQAAADGHDVPASEADLRAYQDTDYACIDKNFEGAGITVRATC